VQFLDAMLEPGAIMLFEHILHHLDDILGAYPDDEAVEGGVVELAQGNAVVLCRLAFKYGTYLFMSSSALTGNRKQVS